MSSLAIALVMLLASGADRWVLIHDSEIYIAEQGSDEARQLTSDGIEKGLARLSKDGKRIEDMDWISNKELIVSGSANPSTVEYVVADMEACKQVRWYGVEGFARAASPDGSHAAYIGSVGHFTPEVERRPQLCIDDECDEGKPFKDYPGRSQHVEFDGGPTWSPDGTAVVISAEDYATKAQMVIVKPLKAVRTDKGDWRLAPGASAFVKP